jgi:polysaccharide export outer membrane protein
MPRRSQFLSILGVWAVFGVCLAGTGCCGCKTTLADGTMPRELDKVSLPTYVIEPPDILLLDAVRVVPLPPYHIEPLDGLFIQASNSLPNEPIAGVYGVESDGSVNLGLSYGAVQLAGMTLEEAKATLEKHLKEIIKNPPPQVLVSLAQSRALQQIRGEHLVRPDGTVGLGTYGGIYVAGMTLQEAKAAIEKHLAQTLLKPEVSLDVYAYNSKVYYIITDQAGNGDAVYRFPCTGNETVLDAMSQIYGLPYVSSKHMIWVARPAPACGGHDQILKVDWPAITRCGETTTNYQILPGDRIYVQAQPLLTLDIALAKIIAPVERVFGVTLLGNGLVNSLQGKNGTGTGSGG